MLVVMWRAQRSRSLLEVVLRCALICLALSLTIFLLSNPADRISLNQQESSDVGHDPYPWEVEDNEEEVEEFKGPRRNLQTALDTEDVFTKPTEPPKVSLDRWPYSDVQKTRQLSLHSTCHNHSSSSPSSWDDLTPDQRTSLAQRLLVDDYHQLLFCPVPLAASGPWMRVFYQLGMGEGQTGQVVLPAQLNNRDNFVYLSSFSPTEQAERVSTYLSFMVTRHPFLRLAVAYKLKFASDNKFFHERYGREIIQRYRPGAPAKPAGNDVKFSEFVEYLVSMREEESNEHWRALQQLCRPCEVGYDYILHHETLAQDSRELLVAAGINKIVPSLPAEAWEQVSVQEAHSLYQQVSPTWVGRLVQTYHLDFALFSYSSIF